MVLSAIILGGTITAAVAHTYDYDIPGYGYYQPSTTHYVYDAWGSLQFVYPAKFAVEQFNSSGFWWRWVEVGAGTEYVYPAWYGNFYIQHGSGGGTLKFSGAFWCDRISTWNGLGFSTWNTPPGGYLDQQSANYPDDCYDATPYSHVHRVLAAP